MASRRTDLSVVMMYIEETWYEIRCEAPKIERKQDISTRVACNSHYPYEVNYGAVEYSVELPAVDHSQRWIFTRMMDRQDSGKMKHQPVLCVYTYDCNGKLWLDYHLQGVYWESMSDESSEPFDMKGGAIDPVDPSVTRAKNEAKRLAEEAEKKAKGTATTATTAKT